MEIEYIGEHLLIGQVGNIFVILSFVAALLATVSFFVAEQKNDSSWDWLGTASFRLHTLSVFSIIGLLFYMLANHFFEYHWVWSHTSLKMPMRFLLSAFWEGQEGSFLLWTFWHVVLGNVLLFTAKSWKRPVMTVISLVQVFLASMILGIYIIDFKVGSNPFTMLLRNHPDFAQLPLFSSANYLDNLDGRGLNPLLQNYWMTIHPPVTFLGYGLTVVPFAYAIAALWRKDYQNWFKPALPWSYLGVSILGTGILMGGAWAYEALSFGGFWAWDPVENASLVPWLTLAGGAHLIMIYKNKGSSLVAAFVLIMLSFILVLYSTFLTRSGVLGETSVHAFTDLGMSGQLLIYLLFFLFLAFGMLVWRYKTMPKANTDEELWSREFWMFVGALILMISAFQISFTTSIPVINKVFGTNMAPPVDPVDHYNSWQLPFAVLTLLAMGFTILLKYKKNDFTTFFKNILPALVGSLVLTMVIGLSLKMQNAYYLAMLFASLFTIAGNATYIQKILKGKVKKAGPALSHIGFGILLLGALVSMSSSNVISSNTSGVDVSQLGEEFTNNENILLLEGDTLPMGDYLVTYNGREKEGIYVRFKVDYLKKTEQGKEQQFRLKPFVQLNDRMGNVPEPDTKHFLTKDIYTHITYATLQDPKEVGEGELEITLDTLRKGDTLFTNNAIGVVQNVFQGTGTRSLDLEPNDMAITARLQLFDFNTKEHFLEPTFVLRDTSYVVPFPDKSEKLGLEVSLEKILTDTGELVLKITESKEKKRDFVIMQAVIFPYINLLWLGAIVMTLGILFSIFSRVKSQLK